LPPYQGAAGMVRSGAYGAVLVIIYLVSGSLWPAMVLHVAQDFYSGVAVYLSTFEKPDDRAPAAR
jgi:hypothetical protein